MREKVEQIFGQIAPSFFGKIDTICDEVITRIYKIRNRQNEVYILQFIQFGNVNLTIRHDKLMTRIGAC